jgi:excisionase family DNA binding protein
MSLAADYKPRTMRKALAFIAWAKTVWEPWEQPTLADFPWLAPVEMPDDPATLLTTRQAAQHLSITTEQLLAHVHDGTLRGINVSRGRKRGRWRFTRADLDAFKASCISQEQPCRFSSPKNPRRITGSLSKSSVVDFSALRAARLARKPSGSKR